MVQSDARVTQTAKIPVSVVVMTKNEERNIAKCLRTVTSFDEVFVVDSGSTDRTCAIAIEYGAKVVDFRWNGQYPKKKQWCLDNLPFTYDWVLYVDADEMVTPELVEEIRSHIERGPDKTGYFVGFDYVFLGKVLHHGLRFYKLVFHERHKVRYEPRDDLDAVQSGEIEGIYNPRVDGTVGRLQASIIHDDHRTLYTYFERHNRYSDWEALVRSERTFISEDDTQLPARRILKKTFDRLPLKAPLAFIYSYVLRAGFLDGRAGLHFALTRAFYYWQVELKIDERRRHCAQEKRGTPIHSTEIKALIVCPSCKDPLSWSEIEATCGRCGRVFPIVDGIPVLLEQTEEAKGASASEGERAHKAQQMAYYDEQDPEFEITRPHGTPRFYAWLLQEKFRRSITRGVDLRDRMALTVCSGSGMDAEYLSRAGASVIASDISVGAARRTRERARRYNLDITPIVADVERLPFRDRSLDLVYVHDGLHHLEQPTLGLREMARVAEQAVSITEPSQAIATEMAIRVGIAQRVEDAGNRVERLEQEDIAETLRVQGFDVVHAERYAMYYRHRPGPVTTALSVPVVFSFACFGWRVANRLFCRIGNKLTIQAVRSPALGEGH